MTATTQTPDSTAGAPVVPSNGVLRPLGSGEVRLTEGFWARRQQVNRTATLPHALRWMRKLGWIDNFSQAAEDRRGVDRRGREFSDSEVYKLIEAMSWEAGRTRGEDLAREIDLLAKTVAGAQDRDGYLHTAFGGPRQRPRYSDLAWGHELYCMGFLIQAAVAGARTGQAAALLPAARSAADHICEAFGPRGNPGICGHPEIELALVELARVTGSQRYLDQAALFLERRGRRSLPLDHFGSAYFSDDIPVREATVFRGHAVRALYLACGAVDVAVETGDAELLQTVAGQFDRTLASRTYLTGGMGSHHADESFGDDFVLPADRAYSETCAGVAAAMLAWRLLLATGEDRYAEVIERVLFNVVATAISDDGQSFFYANTLHQRTLPRTAPTESEELTVGGGQRAAWREVSCCLPNIARLLAGLNSWVATVDDAGLRIHQYAGADIDTRLADGRRVAVRMSTNYPDDGVVQIRVTKTAPGPWRLKLRRPSWAPLVNVTVNGEPSPSASLYREFATGDLITLELPMKPRFTYPDPRIDAIRGCVAVELGPLVLCAESPGGELDLNTVTVDPATEPGVAGGLSVSGSAMNPTDEPWPYPVATPAPARAPIRIPLTPYHRWARSGPSIMRVWLPAQETRPPMDQGVEQ
ncbi:glycoside hydrolase family 127 protein [Kribbella sp. CA-294648]|uniref:glycoside hydrolase family 127 protein n=1 Tax=Kribbella sp. CA-294648 TaxID=3239948 RepID=UPI003D94CDC7